MARRIVTRCAKRVAVLLGGVMTAGSLAAADRELADGWQFRREGSVAWRTVRVPHDWAISGPFDTSSTDGGTGKLPWKGRGFYRTTLELTADESAVLSAGGRAYLTFDGVMASPQVKVNGAKAGEGDYGYLGLTLDVTPWLKDGPNLVEVTADTTRHESRWYPGAGIYRRVTFGVRPKNHVRPGSLAITTPEVSESRATVKVAFETPDGPTNFSFVVSHPRRWDVNDPHLYTLDLLGETFRYGIRTATFTPDDGFHLNGRRLQIKGANLHADLGLLGMAFDRSAMRRQLHLLREMGVNAIRTSHNPPAPEMLDLCDEMGFVVWDECFDKWDGTAGRSPDQDLEEHVIRNLRAFVRRDRNHPSVVVWSVSNEIWEWDPDSPRRSPDRWADRGPDGQTRARNALFAAAVRLEDQTRPVGCGNRPYMNEKRVLDLGLWDAFDVIGWNYYRSYEPVRRALPGKALVYSESASAVSSPGYFSDRLPQGKHEFGAPSEGAPQVDGMDLSTTLDIADVEFDRMEKDRYVAGEFVWTGIDYLGEPAPFPSKARSSYFGCIDLTGVPKDRYYLYRAHWNDAADTLHLVPHWTWTGREKEKRAVFAYTNGDEAELFLNGRSLGRRRKGGANPFANRYYDALGRYRLMWTGIAYEPGEIKVVAWKDGRLVGERAVKTAGTPSRLQLEPEAKLTADPSELLWVRVRAADADGTPNPWATNSVHFALSGAGEIVAVGNGDPCGLKAFTETESHDLFCGQAMAVVRRTGAGPLALSASSAGLEPVSVKLP